MLLSDLLRDVGLPYSLNFNPDGCYVDTLGDLASEIPMALGFIDEKRLDKVEVLNNTRVTYVVCDFGLNLTDRKVIQTSQPRLFFTLLGNKFSEKKFSNFIDPTARIDVSASISKSIHIGANSVIGNATVGSRTVIGSNVIICDNVEIGSNVIVGDGCVLGSEGFGFQRTNEGRLINFPHIGKLVIKDNVTIGANSCVDRGALSNTIIKEGSKIDNLVHIGHNVQVGRYVLIAASTTIGGSSIIGDYSKVWMNCSIADGITIGENSEIGIGSIVLTDVRSGVMCFGNPAKVYSKLNS